MPSNADPSIGITPVNFREALEFATGRGVELPDEYYGSRPAYQRAQAFSVAGLGDIGQIQSVLDSLNQNLANGVSFADWKKSVSSGDTPLDLPSYRLENIFRTNTQTAFNAGRYQQQKDDTDDRPYWMYSAIDDDRTRPSHLEMDGTILPADDDWWSDHYPPNGYNCRCTVISLTADQAGARGIDDDGPDAAPDTGWDYNPGDTDDNTDQVDGAISSALSIAETTTDSASAQIAGAGQRIDNASPVADAFDTSALTRLFSSFGSDADAGFAAFVGDLDDDDTVGDLDWQPMRATYGYTTDDADTFTEALLNPDRYTDDSVMINMIQSIVDAAQNADASDLPEAMTDAIQEAKQSGSWDKWLAILAALGQPGN